MQQNASDLFIKALENEGVEVIYGIPGEENLDLLEAIRKSNIKLILNRHEQAAAFMAATYGRLTGKPAVAISTLGPGATNFTTAAAYATLGGFPLVLITGQKPIKKSKQGHFQIVDIVSMMKPLTKYSKQIVNTNMISKTVREAFRLAIEEKQGCVHIEFPEDISAEEIDNINDIFPISKYKYPKASEESIQEIATIIKNAKFPLALIGSSCSKSSLVNALTNFIDTTKIPFFNTQMAKGVIAEDNPLFLGTAALSDKDYLHDAIDKADVILNIGYDVVEKPPYIVKNKETKIIHLNYVFAKMDHIYQPFAELLGDIKENIIALTSAIGELKQDFSYALKVKEVIENKIISHIDDTSFPIKPQRLVNDVNKVMQDGILALDNGMYKLWFARNYKCLKPNSLLLDNALATMGAGLPSAMEVARIYPEKKVLAVAGDGGFMMNSQEMQVALELGLNLVVLIINDSTYGMIKWKQDGANLAEYSLDFKNPDFVHYAKSYGAKGHRLEKVEDLIPLLNRCFTEKGVHLIDIPIDYSENKKVLTEELKNRSKV